MISSSVIRKVPWVKEKERALDIAIQSFYMIGQGLSYFKKFDVDFEIKNHLAFSSGKLYYDQREIRAAKEYLLNQKDLAQWASEFTNTFLSFAEKYHKTLRKNGSVDFSSFSLSELDQWYQSHSDAVCTLVPYSFIVSMILESVVHDRIVRHLQNSSTEPESLYRSLVVPRKVTTTNLEYRERLKLATLYEKSGADFFEKEAQSIDAYLEEFSWLYYYKPVDTILDREALVPALQKTLATKNQSKEPSVHDATEDSYTKAAILLTDLDFSPTDRSLIGTMQENAWIRTFRRELMSYAFYTSRNFYERASELLNVQRDDFRYAACWEIPGMFQSGSFLSEEEVARRKQDFTIVRYEGELAIASGKDAEGYVVHGTVSMTVEELRGNPVFPGKVPGRVKIVRNQADASVFQTGDILVTPTVAVWMTSLVQACSGIITDEGGVLSHTAVVAREFRKPCIVGTHYATEVLQDGMKILLDADTGSVSLEA